jgi:hypothetical protein
MRWASGRKGTGSRRLCAACLSPFSPTPADFARHASARPAIQRRDRRHLARSPAPRAAILSRTRRHVPENRGASPRAEARRMGPEIDHCTGRLCLSQVDVLYRLVIQNRLASGARANPTPVRRPNPTRRVHLALRPPPPSWGRVGERGDTTASRADAPSPPPLPAARTRPPAPTRGEGWSGPVPAGGRRFPTPPRRPNPTPPPHGRAQGETPARTDRTGRAGADRTQRKARPGASRPPLAPGGGTGGARRSGGAPAPAGGRGRPSRDRGGSGSLVAGAPRRPREALVPCLSARA